MFYFFHPIFIHLQVIKFKVLLKALPYIHNLQLILGVLNPKPIYVNLYISKHA